MRSSFRVEAAHATEGVGVVFGAVASRSRRIRDGSAEAVELGARVTAAEQR